MMTLGFINCRNCHMEEDAAVLVRGPLWTRKAHGGGAHWARGMRRTSGCSGRSILTLWIPRAIWPTSSIITESTRRRSRCNARCMRKRVLGAEHSSTLVTASNLSAFVDLQGKHAEAEQMQREEEQMHAEAELLFAALAVLALAPLSMVGERWRRPRSPCTCFSPDYAGRCWCSRSAPLAVMLADRAASAKPSLATHTPQTPKCQSQPDVPARVYGRHVGRVGRRLAVGGVRS